VLRREIIKKEAETVFMEFKGILGDVLTEIF
jgi:hypothetical protein